MTKWECTVCGYIMIQQRGIQPRESTLEQPLKISPDDWVCPDCGVGKDMFEELA